MRTTTIVFKFNPEASQELLDAKIAHFNSLPKEVLTEFCALHSTSEDNLVSEDINRDTCLRTVVRSWPDLATAMAFVQAHMNDPQKTSYPGVIVSAQVDPE